MTPFVNWEFLP